MPAAAQILPIVKDDPLAHLHDGAIARASGHPIPLRATRIVVRIDGGLAIVRTERVFANTEAEPIEATYTFSVPVHATLARMTVRIGDRHLVAQARLRDAARTDYEDAIDAGKTAVLHEEVLRGIHMLSVGAIPPGGELAVTSTWAIPLQAVSADLALLRVPTTIGQVYGRPPMSDSDAPFHGDARLEADLEVTCDSGSVRLANAGLIDGRAQLPLNAPIDIEVVGWIPRPLRGRAADGRVVTLDIEPAETGEAALDFALLIDRSGSMGSGATIANQSPLSTHDVVVSGLCAADALLHPGDYVEAWQFDTVVERVEPSESGLSALAKALGAPRGGTEIGRALGVVTRRSKARDILLVTDGQSYALDVQELARLGRRITVVLVGVGALDASVGQLAAQTGGELFVVSGADAGDALTQAIASLRREHVPPRRLAALPDHLERRVGGMRIAAAWSGDSAAPDGEAAAIIGAVAAAFALPALPKNEAAQLAKAHGLVCHLTSLVLVNEDGTAQEGLPLQRRVPLMLPEVACMERRSAAWCAGYDAVDQMDLSWLKGPYKDVMHRLAPYAELPTPSARGVSGATSDSRSRHSGGRRLFSPPSLERDAALFAWMIIDWGEHSRALRRGDLSVLPEHLVEALMRLVRIPEVRALASTLSEQPIVVALALAASAADNDRAAVRFARSVLGTADRLVIDAAQRAAGI